MGFRFSKRIKLHKLVNLNLSKGGVGVSVGVPGARFSINSKGRKQASVGIPGTGLSYVKAFGTKSSKNKAKKALASHQINELNNDDYNEALFALSHTHLEAYDFIDFQEEPLEYNSRKMGPLQQAAIEAYNNYKPNFIVGLLANYIDLSVKKREKLKQNIFEAIEKDQDNLQPITVSNKQQQALIANNPEAIHHFLELSEAFETFEDDVDSYEYHLQTVVDEATSIHLNIESNLNENVMDDVITTNAKGAYVHKTLGVQAFNERKYAYVCSLLLGFAKEALALTPLDKVTIDLYNLSENPATGYKERICIAAGEFKEADLFNLNFETLNPITVVENSLVDIKFTKRTGFKEVQPTKSHA
ncbi:MAG TPA: DUF4236 domain-containing protein [Erysipelothrix sp.]|nr:DUF4236 domain-containing protein [Erysipelothrix sp.]